MFYTFARISPHYCIVNNCGWEQMSNHFPEEILKTIYILLSSKAIYLAYLDVCILTRAPSRHVANWYPRPIINKLFWLWIFWAISWISLSNFNTSAIFSVAKSKRKFFIIISYPSALSNDAFRKTSTGEKHIYLDCHRFWLILLSSSYSVYSF